MRLYHFALTKVSKMTPSYTQNQDREVETIQIIEQIEEIEILKRSQNHIP